MVLPNLLQLFFTTLLWQLSWQICHINHKSNQSSRIYVPAQMPLVESEHLHRNRCNNHNKQNNNMKRHSKQLTVGQTHWPNGHSWVGRSRECSCRWLTNAIERRNEENQFSSINNTSAHDNIDCHSACTGICYASLAEYNMCLRSGQTKRSRQRQREKLLNMKTASTTQKITAFGCSSELLSLSLARSSQQCGFTKYLSTTVWLHNYTAVGDRNILSFLVIQDYEKQLHLVVQLNSRCLFS